MEIGAAYESIRILERWGHANAWQGPDPYDALNSQRALGPLRHSVLGRRVITQLVKRSPLDLRSMLAVPPGRSAAALAHAVSAYARGDFLLGEDQRARIAGVCRLLEGQRSEAYTEPCWGYHFDVQTRVFFYPREMPNTIATAFAGQALVDAYERLNERSYLDLATGVANFFLDHVPQTRNDPGAYFGYLPGDRTPIHNASMMVAALFARLSRILGRADLANAARAALDFTVARQRPDGSWPYGEVNGLGWIDNFHTGYVLESLLVCRDADLLGDERCVTRGLDFYRTHLLLPDGTPKYYADKLYPIDAQSVAQSMQTFALATRAGFDYESVAWEIFRFAQDRMRSGNGLYAFQRTRRWTNRTPHIRWVIAPMLLALVNLVASVSPLSARPGTGEETPR